MNHNFHLELIFMWILYAHPTATTLKATYGVLMQMTFLTRLQILEKQKKLSSLNIEFYLPAPGLVYLQRYSSSLIRQRIRRYLKEKKKGFY